ncbi:restriction endonuclease subunit S [Proteus sp. NMG38-2]|uniref:restriction endonuclease subunit S n=1 Tax=Proteus sp. NMG38-2 TaxID=2883107 RepID=UPI001D0A17FF|nr:restriction endonuclease subunit S [Proteus sp. NMG38-2]UDN34903.1 restriction endonuclease subunit S [Proteus sp. NMG38-2]
MKLHSETYDSYKNAEGEWSEAIPSEWQEKRVKDLFRLVTDAAPADNDYELLSLYAGIGVKPRKDLEARGNKASSTDGYWIVRKNDIVVNKLLAWMGSVGLSEYEGVTSPAYDVLRQTQPELDPRYFAYLFRTETAKKIFRKNSRGIMDMRLRLYFDKLGAITVPYPSPTEQKNIADYIDNKVTLIDKKINALSKKVILYKKLRATTIDEIALSGMGKDTPLKYSYDDAIGEIPSHWEVLRLKEVANIQNSNVDKKSHDHEKTVKLCNYVDVYKNDFINSSLEFMQATANDSEIAKFQIFKGDVFITKDSETCEDIAVPALATETLEGVLCGYHLAQIRCNQKIILGEYLFRLFQCQRFGKRFTVFAKGITRVGLGQSAIADALTPIPPLEEQLEIVNKIRCSTEVTDKAIGNLSRQIEKLKELRIAVVNDVITGQIRLKNTIKKGLQYE